MEHLVLADLDKTLIDERYHLTVPVRKVRKAIQSLERRGILFGLCSDSPLPMLQAWQERIGAHGPIVSEQGALVFDPTSRTGFATLPEATEWFPTLRDEVVRSRIQKLHSWSIYLGDSTELIRQKVRVPGRHEVLILVNSQRRHSFAAHLRRVGKRGELSIDSEMLSALRQEVEELARTMTTEPLDVDENPEYGVLILHAERNVKANGVRALVEQLKLSRVTYIGDSWRDLIGDQRVNQTAVNNAMDTYKEHCSYIASASYTEGVLEILGRLLAGSL